MTQYLQTYHREKITVSQITLWQQQYFLIVVWHFLLPEEGGEVLKDKKKGLQIKIWLEYEGCLVRKTYFKLIKQTGSLNKMKHHNFWELGQESNVAEYVWMRATKAKKKDYYYYYARIVIHSSVQLTLVCLFFMFLTIFTF